MKILIVRLDHLGDLLLTTPLVRALSRAGHTVEMILPKAFLPVLKGNPYCQRTYAIEAIAPHFPKTWPSLASWIRSGGYDALLFPCTRPHQLLWSSLFSGVKTRMAMRAGITGRITLHRCLATGPAFEAGRHYSDLQLDFARALDVPTDGLTLDFFPSADEIQIIEQKLALNFEGAPPGPLVGIHPGCAGNTCNLPARVYGELAELVLSKSKSRVVVTGSASERALVESWPESVRKSDRFWCSQGELDLRGLGALISRLSAYVIMSTGPLHLASALKVKTVSPFCPITQLSPQVWGNLGGPSIALEPSRAHCKSWRKENPGVTHCDFRGELTAEMLWDRLAPLLG